LQSLPQNRQGLLGKKGPPDMKKDTHPEYRQVVFQDTSSDFKFITRSTMTSAETIQWEDGNTYPVIKIEVSSASHPFYTGKNMFIDTAGRVEKFRSRYANKAQSSAGKE
jgi:large subunit ribosomal protein L31